MLIHMLVQDGLKPNLMTPYRKGLNVQQATYAVKIYKSHCWIGAIPDVLRVLEVRGKGLQTV